MKAYYYLKKKVSSEIKKPSLVWRFSSVGLVSLGLVLIANAAFPLIIYGLKSHQLNQQLVSPIVLGQTLVEEKDYDNPRNWFSVAPQLPPRPVKITHYSLSIPKLGIEEAVVQIGGVDLMKSLIQYPGTGLPGQFGNTVVFGHSVLPQFYNPKSYRTIFSTLPTIKEGDEVLVNFDGVLYRYGVVKLEETIPDDVTVLEQRYDDSYLSLITCVPPGTLLRRLVVRAKLINS